MHLLSAHITNFRRFADLTIKEIPKTAKLVVLAGPNGSGKSSFFDALLLRYRLDSHFGWNGDQKYYNRQHSETATWDKRITVETDCGNTLNRGNVYVRTAYRNDPDFQTTGLTRQENILDNPPLHRMIEADATVSVNYQRLASQAMEDVFQKESPTTTIGQFRENLIGKIGVSLNRLFLDLNLISVGNPVDHGTFEFSKGMSKKFEYKNLSAGEKAAFDLILDLVVKRDSYNNAIYCIDEPETHMNTRLQAALLKELVELIPDNSQSGSHHTQ